MGKLNVPVFTTGSLALITVMVTCFTVAGSVGARAGTVTATGREPIQVVPPLYAHRVFTLKLAGFACLPVIV
jgi:hypothetical protein